MFRWGQGRRPNKLSGSYMGHMFMDSRYNKMKYKTSPLTFLRISGALVITENGVPTEMSLKSKGASMALGFGKISGFWCFKHLS